MEQLVTIGVGLATFVLMLAISVGAELSALKPRRRLTD